MCLLLTGVSSLENCLLRSSAPFYFFIQLFIHPFIYLFFWLPHVFIAVHGFSPVVVHGFLTGVASFFFFFFFTVNVKTLGHFYLCLVFAALGARCCMQAFCSCGECG